MTFAELTSVERVDSDSFVVTIDPSSWIIRGPNGGYLAALIVRAIEARVADLDGPARPMRSLTLHYPAAPVAGPATITTRIVRAGRSLSTIAADLAQDGKVMVTALAACSPPWGGPTWADERMPDVPSPEAVPLTDRKLALPYMEWWQQRHALGSGVFSNGAVAETGGWLALDDGGATPTDAAVVAAMADAWPPAIFVRGAEPSAVPTVDLTVHFRVTLPTPLLPPGSPALVRFTTKTAAEGFIEEDGHIWSPDGTLIAHSRQLAVIF